MYDDSQGRWFQFAKPEAEVVFKEIMTPEGAPDFLRDRQTLWNVVERSEKRQDAQLLREVELTLPRELDQAGRVKLLREFVAEQFVSRGMVADMAIHEPFAADGDLQPHAHVSLTLRRIDPSTPTGFAAKKERDWNESEEVARAVAEARKRFNNTGLPEDKEVLDQAEARRNISIWRASWADHANRALAEAGSRARIDHRTLLAQGIMREPQKPLGVAARSIERAYGYLRERVTQWIAIKRRASLYEEVEELKRRDPAQVMGFVLKLNDLAESFAAQFRRPPRIPEVNLER